MADSAAAAVIPIVEARERLIERLWPGGRANSVSPAVEHQSAIAGRRIWRELQQPNNGIIAPLPGTGNPPVLDDALFRRAFASAGILPLRRREFLDWLNGVWPLSEAPNSGYMTIVEAVSYLAWGEFLTSNDLFAILEDELRFRDPSSPQGAVDPRWDRASRRLFDAHVNGNVTLTGRNCDKPAPLKPISKSYFANPVALNFGNVISAAPRAGEGAATFEIWRDAVVPTSEFVSAFLARKADEAALITDSPLKRRRAVTPSDERDFDTWVKEYPSAHGGNAPSMTEMEDWAKERNISRDNARKQLFSRIPAKLRRKAGETDKTLRAKKQQ